MKTALEYNLALRARSATRWVEGQQGMLPPEEQFVPPIGYGGDGSVKLTKINITVSSQFLITYSPPPFNSPIITRVPAFGYISGTNTYVYVLGQDGKALERKYNNVIVAYLHDSKTYTYNNVKYPFYQAFSHDEDLRFGYSTTAQDGSRIVQPVLGGSFYAAYVQGSTLRAFGACLFRFVGSGVVEILSMLGPNMITATAYYQQDKWVISQGGNSIPIVGSLLGRVPKSSFPTVTVEFFNADFNLMNPRVVALCVSEYPVGGAHDPFQVAAPPASPSTLGAPLGSPLGG